MRKPFVFTQLRARLWLTGAALTMLGSFPAQAQNDVSGALNNVTDQVKGYVSPILNLAYPVAAIIFIIGAIKVYRKFTNGDPDVAMTAFQLIGGAIFIGLLPTLLKSFFGI